MNNYFERVKEEILASTNWVVSLDHNDLKTFQGADSNQIIVLQSATEDVNEQSLQMLIDNIVEQYW